ncbi:TIR domain-containing protein [Marispirochaeta sp.]|uniref:TIR domain-containing protein n=1 Tax=Marispirochaeta sp. TaxID=2038653 RepID=UPI0029C8DA2D|nr:TIR domain-containing protein [Marispirochaeta sp.]
MISPLGIHICYLHPADEDYALRLRQLMRGDCLRFSDSSGIGEDQSEVNIKDNQIRNAVATAVLIGPRTAASCMIDREIYASLLNTARYLHTGLFGILLPSCSAGSPSLAKPEIVPPRLADNLQTGFADLYQWREDTSVVRAWFQRAVRKRDTILPNNRRGLLKQETHHSVFL